MALRCPASASPKNSQFFLPIAVGRMAFSTPLLSICLASLALWASLWLASCATLRFDPTIADIFDERLPVREGITDGLAKAARRKMTSGGLHIFECSLQSIQYHRALTRPHDCSQGRPSLTFAQACFDSVEILDLIQDPVCSQGNVLQGLVEVAPRVSPATYQFDALAFIGKSGIGRIGVALQHASKVHGNDVFQAGCTATRLPMKDRIKPRRMRCPQVAFLGFSIPRLKVRHRRLMLRPARPAHPSGCLRQSMSPPSGGSVRQSGHTCCP